MKKAWSRLKRVLTSVTVALIGLGDREQVLGASRQPRLDDDHIRAGSGLSGLVVGNEAVDQEVAGHPLDELLMCGSFPSIKM